VPPAAITHPACAHHDWGAHHPESPARLAAVTERLIATGLDARLLHHTAPAATREQLERVHAAAYIDAIEAASTDSSLAYLDPDTSMSPDSLAAARHAAGAAVLGVDLVRRGECDNAFCAVRPPGHHAERARAMGFCIFNSIAVAAAHALEAHGLARVAIVDFDVHHGNGTEDIFADEPRVLMVGTFQYPLYPYSGVEPLGPNMVNVPLSPGSGGDALRAAVTERWLPALERHRPELILVSAGFDAHRDDPLANLDFDEDDFAWVTRELVQVAKRHAQGRIVSSLEGGYDLSALGRSAAAHVRVLLGD
jgi:acetoin utilization deacetylase AcuC-like enzyme